MSRNKLLVGVFVMLMLQSCSHLVPSLLDQAIPTAPECKPEYDKDANAYLLNRDCMMEWELYMSKVKALHRDLKAITNELKDRLE